MAENKCNLQSKCDNCQKSFWLRELSWMENYVEKGVFCDDCLDQAEKKCRRCNKLFINRELTAKEAKEHEEWKILLMKERGEKSKHFNLSLSFCHDGCAPCHRKVNENCHGHQIKHRNFFCSSECSNDWNKVISRDGVKFAKWKAAVEKLGWTQCQTKNCFADNPKMLEFIKSLGIDEEKLACWGMVSPGEIYCESCKAEKEGRKVVKENTWQEAYRKYWNLTDENTYLTVGGNSNTSLRASSANLQAEKNISETGNEHLEAKNQILSQQEIKNLQSKDIQQLRKLEKLESNFQANNYTGWIIGGVLITASLFSWIILVLKNPINKK